VAWSFYDLIWATVSDFVWRDRLRDEILQLVWLLSECEPDSSWILTNLNTIFYLLSWTIKPGKNLAMENWCFICNVIFSHSFQWSLLSCEVAWTLGSQIRILVCSCRAKVVLVYHIGLKLKCFKRSKPWDVASCRLVKNCQCVGGAYASIFSVK